MKTAKKTIKQLIKDKAAEAKAIRQQIRDLTWKGEPPKPLRDEAGRRLSGKKARKPFRMPWTGPARDSLWADKRQVGSETRFLLLMYGMLRHRPYKSIEPHSPTATADTAYRLQRKMKLLLSEQEMAAFTTESIVAWLKGGEAPKLAEAA